MRTIEEVRHALAAHAPRALGGTRRAAVAVVLHETAAQVEMLFIERSRRVGDPWSGQMAFPGGRLDPDDADARAAAERETREEVALDLGGAELLGQLDDLHAGVRVVAPLVLSAFVYRIAGSPILRLNHEVREALWISLSSLLEPTRHIRYRWGPTRFPGIVVGEPDRHVVWGLTHQLVEGFFRLGGVTLPHPR